MEDKNIKSEIEIAKEKSRETGIPYKDLAGEEIPNSVLQEIPEEAAVFYKFVPLKKRGNILEIGMIDPEDLKAKEALRFITRQNQLETEIFIITLNDFKEIIKQYSGLKKEVSKALRELREEIESPKKKVSKKKTIKETAEEISSNAPISKIVAVILRHAVEGKASDIHIEPTEDNVKVRFRVDGVLHNSLILPKDTHASIISRIKIISRLKIDESRIPQDGRFHTTIADKKIDFRVSTLPVAGGEKAVLRVLDPETGLSDFSKLGLNGHNLEILQEASQQPFGSILISGPTGSGKTTTLYAILKTLNQEGVNIISLEDPVEYYIEGINQSQIRPEIDYNFASGLRHILRQDPDIIMVGEIRDEETADLSVHAALTGHILLSTIHTNNAIGVIPRLIDMGISSFLLPPSLNLAVAQRLCRRLCSHCKKEIAATGKIAKTIEEELAKMGPEYQKRFPKPYKIYQAKGCKYCGNKGTQGRIAIFEMVKMTPQLEEIIVSNPTEGKISEEANRQGMITMKQDGILKVLNGDISFEELLRVTEE